jgi:hypothetical protein
MNIFAYMPALNAKLRDAGGIKMAMETAEE